MERQPTKLLYVLPPFSSFVVMCMNCLAGLIEAHLIVCQQMNAQDFSDRRGAAAVCSHVHSCSIASESYLGRKLRKIEFVRQV